MLGEIQLTQAIAHPRIGANAYEHPGTDPFRGVLLEIADLVQATRIWPIHFSASQNHALETRMFDLPGILGTSTNLIVIIIGFGLIVFVHELGHFLAAKWAGIRVLAFSMGFGPIVCSYRKGIGFRRGSSEPEYLASLRDADSDASSISPTEYRFSALPLGGYVKMLGQEDLNPGAVSSSPDSYQNCSIPKRLVVISAGVVVNAITAALLFIAVFMVGLESLPAQVGTVVNGSPAAKAVALDHDGVDDGLVHGDVITFINNSKIYGFRDLSSTIAMAPKSSPSKVTVVREGFAEPIVFEVHPEKNAGSGLLDLGVLPMRSTSVVSGADSDEWSRVLEMFGGIDLRPGDQLVSIGGQPAQSPYAILEMTKSSAGEPFEIRVTDGVSERGITLRPLAEVQKTMVDLDGDFFPVSHVLGLNGVLCVDPLSSSDDARQGLAPGDVFVRIDDVLYPSVFKGIETLRALAGKTIEVEVLRNGQVVPLQVEVSKKGTVGFYPASTLDTMNLVAWPKFGSSVAYPASQIISRPGTKLLAIEGEPIAVLRDARDAVIAATDEAFQRGDESFDLEVRMELPLPTQPDGNAPIVTETWTLSRAEVEQLRGLGWTLAGGDGIISLFEPVLIVDRAPGPVAAVRRGLHESKRVMIMTYLTFLRLYEGSVQVKHLKGPVGIAHLGTQIADQGFMMVLFFMGLISINLAVINFLPLPIVDGGQFLMLIYEWIRGKPLPIVVQNVVTMAGLLLIGTAFIYITFQDITALFGG